jgi:ParE-like toxin of type II ParDE toxin-antitoxin system
MRFLTALTARLSLWPTIPDWLNAKTQGLQGSMAPSGDWRVVYIIDDAAKRVSITRVRHRREVY